MYIYIHLLLYNNMYVYPVPPQSPAVLESVEAWLCCSICAKRCGDHRSPSRRCVPDWGALGRASGTCILEGLISSPVMGFMELTIALCEIPSGLRKSTKDASAAKASM